MDAKHTDAFNGRQSLLIIIAVSVAVFFVLSPAWGLADRLWGLASVEQGKAAGPKRKTPVSFVASFLVSNVALDGKSIKGIAKTASFSGRDLLYRDVELNLIGVDSLADGTFKVVANGAKIEFSDGAITGVDDLKVGQQVKIEGKNNRDGTFEIKKIIISR